jgi:hypothetical protein
MKSGAENSKRIAGRSRHARGRRATHLREHECAGDDGIGPSCLPMGLSTGRVYCYPIGQWRVGYGLPRERYKTESVSNAPCVVGLYCVGAIILYPL